MIFCVVILDGLRSAFHLLIALSYTVIFLGHDGNLLTEKIIWGVLFTGSDHSKPPSYGCCRRGWGDIFKSPDFHT